MGSAILDSTRRVLLRETSQQKGLKGEKLLDEVSKTRQKGTLGWGEQPQEKIQS